MDHWNITPWEYDRSEKLARVIINQTRKADTNAGEFNELAVLCAKSGYLLTDLYKERSGIVSCFETQPGN